MKIQNNQTSGTENTASRVAPDSSRTTAKPSALFKELLAAKGDVPNEGEPQIETLLEQENESILWLSDEDNLENESPIYSDASSLDTATAPAVDFEVRSSANAITKNTPLTSPEVAQIAAKIVQSLYVGKQRRNQHVVLMDVHIPGRGDIRLHVRQANDAIRLKISVKDEHLRQLLHARQSELETEARNKGINLSQIQIVR